MILITSWFKNIIMGEWVTASTKVRREILEKAKEYNINISEVLRKALEEEVKKKEEKNARIIGLSI
jgi:Post-segregation antitoxin CcdA.